MSGLATHGRERAMPPVSVLTPEQKEARRLREKQRRLEDEAHFAQTLEDRFVRCNEFCFRLGGITKNTLYNWIRAGKMPPPIKHGRSSLWHERDVREAIARISAKN